MQYRIKLKIDYSYAGSSDHARSLLHVCPPNLEGAQRVVARHLEITPKPDERRDRKDFFDNPVSAIAYHDPIQNISISLDALVERHPSGSALDLSPRLSELRNELANHLSLGPEAPHHFLGRSPLVHADEDMADFALKSATSGVSILQILADIGLRLWQEMKFDPTATDVNTPANDAFRNRHGVCQDFSHIMIACLKSLGIPAGYVSGFLRTVPPEGQERLEGADAMHAWVRAWCGSRMGWVEYDPTNNVFVSDDHVIVARGRDYSDVAPMRGTMRTAGSQIGHHSVDVLPILEQDTGS